MIKDVDQWISSVREALQLSESPVQQKDGRWKVVERLAAWKATGPRIFDEYLDRFQKVTVEVLREHDPQFKLPPDRRYTASIHGKVMKHSRQLRKGLAETLALLGSYPEYLTSSSYGKAEETARLSVRAILEGGDWEIWASMNDVLPLLAEAAPKEFLDAVEEALITDPSPFDRVFAQEGSGFTGNNYMTGLLWALESLAWDEGQHTRVIVILGELASRDPGGNWGNRPANSLWTILLPWFPQTVAPIPKRVAAVATLQKEQPEVAWQLLLNLFPQARPSTSMSHKPIWRKTIPADWSEGVTNQDYWEQVKAYAEMAVNQATNDRSKLAALVDHMNQLPPASRQKLISQLASDEVVSLPDEDRLIIWNELTDFVARHRRFAKAKWALRSEDLDQIASVAEKLEPKEPSYKYRRLFTLRDFDLYEETDNYVEQGQKLHNRRKAAVGEIYSRGGVPAVIEFGEAVASAGQVGFAFGEIATPEDEIEVLPALLQSESHLRLQFVAGFVTGRFRTKGWKWVDGVELTKWTSDQKASFLAHLPFISKTWSRAERLLEDQEGKYWAKTHASPYEGNDEELAFGIDRLLDNGRVLAAVSALEKLVYGNQPINNEQIVRALHILRASSESLKSMDPHGVVQLIKRLQEDLNTDQEELFKIEWAFLALLDGGFGSFPTLLHKTLAKDPAFFCEIIRAIFRSDKEEAAVKNLTEEQQAIATNAYRLLMEWKTPPGTQGDGTFNAEALHTWLNNVKEVCRESGHLKIALQEVGKVLFYSPPDPDGLWIHRSVADILNAKVAGDIRLGYEIEIFNSRGAHFVDPEGKPERELANHYRKQAEEVEIAGYHRLAISLREAASSYEREAEQLPLRMRLED